MKEYLHEEFEALKNQESWYKHCDYLNENGDGVCVEKKPVINKKCRFQMAQWCFEVVEFCNYNEEIASIAISYMDRFLSSKHANVAMHDIRSFQLATMCSLQLAMKFHNSSPNINIDFLLQIGNGCHTKEEILSMKRKILHALSWRLCPPTSYVFLDFIINNIFQPISISNNTKESILNISRKQLKLATLNYYLSLAETSVVAFASVFNAIEEVKVSKNIEQEFIHNLNNVTGFKYNMGQKKKDSIFWSVKTLIHKLLNKITFDSIKGGDDKILYSVLVQKQKKEYDHSTVETSSPVCINASIA